MPFFRCYSTFLFLFFLSSSSFVPLLITVYLLISIGKQHSFCTQIIFFISENCCFFFLHYFYKKSKSNNKRRTVVLSDSTFHYYFVGKRFSRQSSKSNFLFLFQFLWILINWIFHRSINAFVKDGSRNCCSNGGVSLVIIWNNQKKKKSLFFLQQ